jgi:7-carboxy-7-deazaguanine synthase
MAYAVKELFKTLQGEGGQAGRAAVFCRFTGCNLWSGREADRLTAVCKFCDTDFVGMDGPGGGRFASAEALTQAIVEAWDSATRPGLVVFTGGEPLLQLDDDLIAAVVAAGFSIAVETNGTIAAPQGIDWICVSPKSMAPLAQTSGSELKLVYPQADAAPEFFAGLDFEHFWLQPMDGPDIVENLQQTVAYCIANPPWRLSLQTHKIIGIR